eukprot:scaffold315458_cov21-Tisochrysis_lutea.AAC.1
MHATSLAHYTRISNVGAYGPGAGTIRPPVDNSHKGTFPVGSIFYVCQRGDLLGLERIVDKGHKVDKGGTERFDRSKAKSAARLLQRPLCTS